MFLDYVKQSIRNRKEVTTILVHFSCRYYVHTSDHRRKYVVAKIHPMHQVHRRLPAYANGG